MSTDLLFGYNVASVPNLRALRQYPIHDLDASSQIGVGGRDLLGDFGGGLFQWVPSSITADNGLDVIAPYAGGFGRWHKTGGGSANVQDTMGGSTVVAPSQAAVKRYVDNTYLYAGNYGVVGDARMENNQVVGTDDTDAIRTFLALCTSKKRIAYFGGLRCKVSGPLVLNSTGLVFDGQGYAGEDPGFYPVGSGYTVLRVQGIIPDLRVGVYGSGQVNQGNSNDCVILDANNNLSKDTRPNLTGVQLSGSQGDNIVMALSKVSYVRVWNLPRGILINGLWDTNIDKLATEFCGGSGENDYAIDIQDGGFVGQTTNESVIHYIQAEHSYGRSIRISPNVLSCAFHKIHSERSYAKAGVTTWQIAGGSCTFDNMRLDGTNPNGINGSCVALGANTVFTTLRGENLSVKYGALAGSTATFIECSGSFSPITNQNGFVNFQGGTQVFVGADGYTTVKDANILSMSCGFVAPGARTRVINCRVSSLSASDPVSAVDLISSDVKIPKINTIANIRLLNGTLMSCTTGSDINFGYQMVMVDESSTINANVTCDFAGLELNGLVQGNLTLITQLRSIAGSSARVNGNVLNWGPPGGSEYIGPSFNGRYSKNLAVVSGQPTGWIYSGGSWKPLANL